MVNKDIQVNFMHTQFKEHPPVNMDRVTSFRTINFHDGRFVIDFLFQYSDRVNSIEWEFKDEELRDYYYDRILKRYSTYMN